LGVKCETMALLTEIAARVNLVEFFEVSADNLLQFGSFLGGHVIHSFKARI
jgi:hypothetical protein